MCPAWLRHRDACRAEVGRAEETAFSWCHRIVRRELERLLLDAQVVTR
jgi:hypothetical protein